MVRRLEHRVAEGAAAVGDGEHIFLQEHVARLHPPEAEHPTKKINARRCGTPPDELGERRRHPAKDDEAV